MPPHRFPTHLFDISSRQNTAATCLRDLAHPGASLMRKYAKTHEWYEELGGGKVRIGITKHAAQELSDVVFVELPEVGKKIGDNGSICILESVKAVSDAYAPAGTIVEVNNVLKDKPALVNEDPEGAGWIVVLQADKADCLNGYLDEAAYLATLK